MAEERQAERPAQQIGGTTPTVRWDDSQMRTAYANACNVVSTREEVVLFFGINQGMRGGVGEIVVELGNRIMLNPHAAKRLNLLLTNVLREHEARFGTITVETQPRQATETTTTESPGQ
jgi:hypothetical protein